MKGYVIVPYVGNYCVPVEDIADANEAWDQAIEKLGKASNKQRDSWITEEEFLQEIQEPCGTANYSCNGEWFFEEEKLCIIMLWKLRLSIRRGVTVLL